MKRARRGCARELGWLEAGSESTLFFFPFPSLPGNGMVNDN